MSRATRARTDVIGTFVGRSAALPPATGVSEDLFSVTGSVLLTSFWGYCTVAVPTAVLTWALALDPDDGGSDVVLGTALSVSALAVGTWISLNPTAGGVLVAEVDVAYGVSLATPITMDAGDIKLTVAGGGAIGTTARARWGCTYVPWTDDGAVVAV